MELKDDLELAVTRKKLQSLKVRYEAVRRDPAGDAHLQKLTLRSLKRIIQQLKEEILRFESRATVSTGR